MSATPLLADLTFDRADVASPQTHAWTTRASYVLAKRVVDFTLGLLLLIALLPALALIAAAVLIDSGRPVFFVQKRVGSRPRRKRGVVSWAPQMFGIVKFRTMTRDADKSPIHEEFVKAFTAGTHCEDDDAPFKLAHDPRITRVGHFLRRTSLDELPQLINVLTGDMSLVGPRPVPTYEVAAYDPHHWERLAALPGITGAWQVNGRGRVTFDEMMEMDIAYVRQQSLAHDIGLLAKTLPIVFTRTGAR